MAEDTLAKQREADYYWVILKDGREVVARWSYHGWWELHGTDATFDDDEFESIGEIIRRGESR